MVETLNCTNINLKYGSKGADVTLLQTHLKTLGYYVKYNGYNLKIDGEYLTYTQWAVKNFQKDTGNSQTGEVDSKTCKSLNEKILAKNGITTTTATTKISTPATSITSVKNAYEIDTTKNVWKSNEANIHIQGLNFIISNVNRKRSFNDGDWKTIDLMEGQYDYIGKTQPREYSLDFYLKDDDYWQLHDELGKLQRQICKVASDIIGNGNYKIKVTVADDAPYEKKITLDLTESLGG